MVHCYRALGRNIALDVSSGAVHLLDDAAYAVITGGDLSAFSPEEAEEARDELDGLRRAGLLDSPEFPAEIGRGGDVVKALCLLVAHDCNMKCAYCFAGEGEYGGGRGLMSVETARAAIDFLLTNSGNRKNLEVDFFGGEPLLNWQTVKDTVAYGEERANALNKNIRFTLTTNGLLLDGEKIDFINAHMRNIVLSIDGREEINDAVRTDKAGRGVYGRVVPNFLKLVEKRGKGEYYVRGTFTRANADFAEDVLHLNKLGFNNISVEPAVGEAFGFNEEDLPALLEEYERLANIMTDKDFTFFHFMIDLTGGPCLKKRVSGCGAGGEYAAVAYNGDLYPCHQFAGKKAFHMGSVYGGLANTGIRELFAGNSPLSKESCARCWAKFYCGGGCAANAFESNGDIKEPDKIGCALERKRVECAIALSAKKMDKNAWA
jgi:uncharacterized protein